MTLPKTTTRRAEREREILDAAAKLFRDRGYASTTIRDIGAAAQLNHASSHYYFGSKAAILYAIYQEALDTLLERFDAVPDGDPATTLAEIVRTAVSESARRPDHTAVFFQERLWLEMHLPAAQAAEIRQRQGRFRTRVTEVVQRGVDSGLFRPVDPGIVVEMIVGMATWAYQSPLLPNGEDQCAELLIAGLTILRTEKR